MSQIITPDDCNLCKEARRQVGTIGDRGTVIFRTGYEPGIDWVGVLQRNIFYNIQNKSENPLAGLTCMVMPVGHFESYSGGSSEWARRKGETTVTVYAALEEVIGKEGFSLGPDGLWVEDSLKYKSKLNTQRHLHSRPGIADKTLEIPTHRDTFYINADKTSDVARAYDVEGLNGDRMIIVGLPLVGKEKMDEGLYHHLAETLTGICKAA